MSKNGVEPNYQGGKCVMYQRITTLSVYDLEGDVENLIGKLLNTTKENYTLPTYCSNKKISITFDKFELSVDRDEEDQYFFKIYGIRTPTPEETVALEQEQAARDEALRQRRKAEFERLKREFEGK